MRSKFSDFFCLLNGGINKLNVCVELSSFLNPWSLQANAIADNAWEKSMIWFFFKAQFLWLRLRAGNHASDGKINLQIFSILWSRISTILWILCWFTTKLFELLEVLLFALIIGWLFFLPSLTAKKGNWGEHINLQHVIETGAIKITTNENAPQFTRACTHRSDANKYLTFIRLKMARFDGILLSKKL